jgi:SAM-dependent methyltransferase
MTSEPPTCPTRPAPVRDVATVVEARESGCTVRFLDGGGTAEARWADALRQRGVAVRPGHLVVVAACESVAAPDPATYEYEVVWRGPAVATVAALDGDRLTYTTGSPAVQTAIGTLRDTRPLEERQPIRVGQQVVVAPTTDNPEAVALLDVAADGLPLHPARLRAAILARAARPPAAGAAGADPRRIVAEGYDRMAERYARWAAEGLADGARPRYEAVFLGRLPAGARVLELGCGGGGPTTRRLAARFALTGIDLSARQIDLARANVPGAEFVHGDMTRVAFPPGSFDGVAAFYAFLHLPHGELAGLLRRIGAWLRPGGVLVATLAAGANRGTVEPDWLGVPMYFSGEDPADVRRFLHEAGLQVEALRGETILEDGRPTVFRWVVASRGGAGPQ